MERFIAVTTRHDDNKMNFNPDVYYKRLTERGLGVIPLVQQPAEPFKALMARCSGLIITGGDDIDPTLYGEKKLPQCGTSCQEDDAVDAQAFRYAMAHHLPVLGICRGLQFINVALGGTLFQDLATQNPKAMEHMLPQTKFEKTQHVRLTSDGWLRMIMGRDEVVVNSTHHQAVRILGPGVKVAAYADDGVIEGLQYGQSVYAVQWHPERLTDQSESRLIFDFFKDLCERSEDR